ncbi:MAG: hypothetical protein QXN71_01675 [Candidatus Aenigmatarchaeota archaeon]
MEDLQGEMLSLYEICREIFSESKKNGRTEKIEILPFEEHEYAVLGSSEIPEKFRRKNGKHLPFTVTGKSVFWRGHFVYSEPFYIFVPERIEKRFRRHKAFHECVEAYTGDCVKATLMEFRAVSVMGEDFLRDYTEGWIEENEEWLKKSVKSQRGFLGHLPHTSQAILKRHGYL